MKTMQEILSETTDYDVVELLERKCSPILQPNDCLKAMEEYGKQQWNEAIEAAAENAEIGIQFEDGSVVVGKIDQINDVDVLCIHKPSILKLLKK